MELISIISAKIIWLMNTADLNRRGLRVFPNLTNALTEAYDFDEQPDTAPVTPGDGNQVSIKFVNGQFEDDGDSYRVGLEIYADGIIADSSASTQVTERFLAHVVQWATTNFGFKFDPALILRKLYGSEVVARFDTPLATAFKSLEKFSELLTAALPGSRQNQFSLATMVFSSPPPTGGTAPAFSIERRTNTPVEANVFFCKAPVDTDVHINLLGELDKLLSQ
jgi:hypothetical protein